MKQKKISNDERMSRAVRTPVNFSNQSEQAAMWYFIGWSNRLSDWSLKRRRRYALEISKVSQAFPLTSCPSPPMNAAKTLKSEGVKLIGADGETWLLLDAQGNTLTRVTGLRLYALFVYLVDSLTLHGVDDMSGFDWVKLAKKIIVRDAHGKTR